MIKIENIDVCGLEPAIRGMHNPMNSWGLSDSGDVDICDDLMDLATPFRAGPKDLELMQRLADSGPVHAKYRRMIVVYLDIVAPLYWWKEFDTYKVGTVANSCNTMHKISEKKFTLADFSYEHLLITENSYGAPHYTHDGNTGVLAYICDVLNFYREKYLETKNKMFWWQMIQLLPSSYNQRRTVMLNYEVLANIYALRKDSKLDEWQDFCKIILNLPYSKLIIGNA